MNRKFNGFTLLILLIFVIAVFVALVVFVIPWKRFVSPESFLDSASQNVSPTPIPTSDWKTYVNDEYSFSTQYHPFSEPTELIGDEEVGQFTYLLQVNFSEGTNPLKSKFGYSVEVSQKDIEDYRTELVGHITDAIDSEEEIEINGNTWTKLNYQYFVTTENVPMTMAILNGENYSYTITASAHDISTILSSFELLK